MEKDISLNTENYVVMANNLIKSKSKLSLNEIKLLRLTIMQVMATDNELMTYQIHIKELAKLIELNDDAHLYRTVQIMARHLLQEVVCICSEETKNWEMFQWCSSCRYRDGIITIKLHDDLKPYLIQLKKNYTQYMLADILVLKSVYAIRIYELLREGFRGQKVYADNCAIVILDVDTIRKATNTEEKYSQMGHFKVKVIDIAVREINDKLGYHVTYEDVKSSRKIVGFKFKIESKNNIFGELSHENH